MANDEPGLTERATRRSSRSRSRERKSSRRHRDRSREKDTKRRRSRSPHDQSRSKHSRSHSPKDRVKKENRVEKKVVKKYKYWDVPPVGFEHITPIQYKAMQGELVFHWRSSSSSSFKPRVKYLRYSREKIGVPIQQQQRQCSAVTSSINRVDCTSEIFHSVFQK